MRISIHALRKESDAYCGRIMSPCSAFQSTLSVRRATQRILDAGLAMEFQSTLSVRRATGLVVGAFVGDGISIHALRKESDSPWSLPRAATEPFQSTLSVRRATRPPTMSDTNCIFQSTLSVRRATHADWQGMAPF